MDRRRNPLQRLYGRNDLHFVTFSCYRRRAYLGSVCARNRFVRILDQVRLRHGFDLLGYVLKQRVSRSLQRRKAARGNQMELAFAQKDESPAFWQRRFYDFNVWSEKKL